MDSERDLDQLLLLQSEAPTPTDQNPKMKRLKKNDSTANDVTTSSAPSNEIDGLDTGNDEFDGFDPLFGDSSQFSAKRVLDFDDSFDGFGSEDENDDPDFDKNKNKQEKKKRESSIEFLDNKEKKKRKSSIEFRDNKEKKKREGSVEFRDNKEKKRRVRSDLEKNKSIVSSRKEKKERKARSNQQADFQRVMRDMKGVGFKPIPMVEKSISSVLEKIRKRKMEVSKKWASYTEEDEEVDGGADKDEAKEVGGTKNDLAKEDGGVEKDQVKDDGVAEKDKENMVSLTPTSEEKPESSDEQTTCGNLIQIPSKDAITQSFRAPINDTQDLLMDSERNNSQDDELPSCPDEDITPSAPSMNLRWDSGHSAAVDDDLSSSDEESDKENTDPHPKHLQRSSTATGDPVKDFVDEEALEDDSDDDFLRSQEQDDEDNSDMEENCDYIATDVKEKPIDGEMRNQLHQQWDQQHDEAVTEKLLQKLKYGTKKREPSISDNEDADRTDADEEEEEDDDEEDKNVPHMSSCRATTKRLKQMIPLMFTDKDDGFVSSDDEETERMLSKQCLLQKVEMEKQPKVLPPVADETSKEVLDRIKKQFLKLYSKKVAAVTLQSLPFCDEHPAITGLQVIGMDQKLENHLFLDEMIAITGAQ
ncbi:glutamic acid-rich protein-like isoform X2 [Chenopodium quinoa]|uniref:glutamic acid-rich protein-like isoform X2 n=1 Tax=Chenopodium quinoa TaxID=63459 RepID=UPI000B78AC47|nr:glutamic acid-rich protein-like isoform X2 [Chenopodium quinoa]